MKKVILLLLSACSIFACTHTPKWELVWEDNFDGAEPDTSVWSRIPRGKPDWQNTQSFDDRCYEETLFPLIPKTSMYMEWIFGRTVLYSMSTENETLFILELKPNKKDSFLLISRNIC